MLELEWAEPMFGNSEWSVPFGSMGRGNRDLDFSVGVNSLYLFNQIHFKSTDISECSF